MLIALTTHTKTNDNNNKEDGRKLLEIVVMFMALMLMMFSQVYQFSSVQSLSHVWLFATSWTAALQASLSITSSWSLFKIMSIQLLMLSNHPSHPLSSPSPPVFLQSFRASGSFPMSQLFGSGGQCIGVSASASVLPMNIQDWSLLGWTGWISLQSKGLSKVFSNTTVKKHQFFSTQLSL